MRPKTRKFKLRNWVSIHPNIPALKVCFKFGHCCAWLCTCYLWTSPQWKILSHPPPRAHLLHVTKWLTPQMFSSIGLHSIQHRATWFIFTMGIQNMVGTISRPFRRAFLSMVQWRTSYPETRSFSWSDSWLGRTLPSAKLSPWYPQGCSTDYFRLDP